METHQYKNSKQQSLLQKAQEIKKLQKEGILIEKPKTVVDEDKIKQIEEQQFLAAMQGSALNAMISAKQTKDLGQIQTYWRLPKAYFNKTEEQIQEEFKDNQIFIDGENYPPLIQTFKDMEFNKKILDVLHEMKIKNPTPIQKIGLPSALMGRDMICLSPSGTGKTLVYLLPALLMCIQEEMKLPIIKGEGPLALILVPSRELAIQNYDLIQKYVQLFKEQGYPELKSTLCIGGVSSFEQVSKASNGLHIMVGTPGRISQLITEKKFYFQLCKYVALDEADRLLDMIFEEEIKNILDHSAVVRQTMLFSSTMPRQLQQFAKQALNQPIIVNEGRTGAASLNVIQDIKYVKAEQKLQVLLQSLQKTAPPVIIFCDKIQDVDDINLYLMLKGVSVTTLHSGKNQEERTKSFREFQRREKDVLVATDLAAKGIDFQDIKHVINFAMPNEIETYVHRIGRTGRQGKTGMSTTMVNRDQDLSILSDLKLLLIEAKQKIPDFMENINVDDEVGQGCGFCGGLGHRQTNCPKIEIQKMKALANISQKNKEEKIQQEQNTQQDENLIETIDLQ